MEGRGRGTLLNVFHHQYYLFKACSLMTLTSLPYPNPKSDQILCEILAQDVI